MSYTPTNWQTGDTVTAEKLNKMEQGIATDDALVVPIYHEVAYPEGGGASDEYYVPAEYAQAVYDGFFEHPTVFFSFYNIHSSGIPELAITFEAKWIKSGTAITPSMAVFATDYIDRQLAYVIQNPGLTGEKPFDTWVLNKASYAAGENWYLAATTADVDFVITLTPTAQDFSGTMDKIPSEIYEAFQAGLQIVFYIPSMGAKIIPQQFLDNGSSVVCAGQIVYDVGGQNVLIHIATSTSGQTYSTQIFPLTPMS